MNERVKVNRVFFYSEEVAKNNGNGLLRGIGIVISTISIILFAILAAFVLLFGCLLLFAGMFGAGAESSFAEALNQLMWLNVVGTILVVCAAFGSYVNYKRKILMVKGYAQDENGYIYCINAIPDGKNASTINLCIITGCILFMIFYIFSDGNLLFLAGFYLTFIALYIRFMKPFKFVSLLMKDPNSVARIVENIGNNRDKEVIRIVSVHNIIENNKSIVVNCNYSNTGTNETNSKKDIIIHKAYIEFEDLKKILQQLKN